MKTVKIFNSKLELFMLKRVLILLVILAAMDIAFFKEKEAILLGLLIGAPCGILRFSFMAETYRRFLCSGDSSHTTASILIRFYIGILGTITILIATIAKDVWLFGGVTAGILLIPLVLTINSLTEGLGITHNNFE